MKFQVKYWRKGAKEVTIEKVDFVNLAALKRWYKKEYEAGKMQYDFFDGWDYENDKQFSYFRRMDSKNKLKRP